MGEWQVQRLKYGNGIRDDQLKTMLMNTLSDAMQTDIRRRPEVTNLKTLLDYINVEIGNANEDKLVEIQTQRMGRMTGAVRTSALKLETEADQEPVVKPVEFDHSAMEQIQDMITAALQPGGPRRPIAKAKAESKAKPGPKAKGKSNLSRPDPKFAGCWHCESTSHSRRGRPLFQEILKTNGGKVPDGYQGKFERANNRKVSALTTNQDLENLYAEEESELDEDSECGETMQWAFMPLPSASGPRPTKSCLKACSAFVPTTTGNGFGALCDDSDTDDESQMVKALTTFATSVKTGTKVSQKQAKKSISRVTIAQIAADVTAGKYGLPDLPDLDDEEYYSVWALVDSGAGASCADFSKHFPGATQLKGHKKPVRLTTASGEVVKAKGQFLVKARLTEGHRTQTRFLDAPVDMPVLAVSQISQGGALGSDVSFSNTGGTITDNQTGVKTAFVKRNGVYFLRLIVRKKPLASDADPEVHFARPVAP